MIKKSFVFVFVFALAIVFSLSLSSALQVSDLKASKNPTIVGEKVTFTFKITNDGGVNLNSVPYTINLGDGRTLSGSYGKLNKGKSATVTVDKKLNSNKDISYNSAGELNVVVSSGTVSSQITLNVRVNKPDLTVKNVLIGKYDAKKGYPVTFTVENKGAVKADKFGWKINYQAINSPESKGVSDFSLKTVESTKAVNLASDSSTTVTDYIKLPGSVAALVSVEINSVEVPKKIFIVEESDKTNNLILYYVRLDAAKLIESKVSAYCTENDWTFKDDACKSNSKLIRTWTKTNSNCYGGIQHIPSEEEVGCEYKSAVKQEVRVPDQKISEKLGKPVGANELLEEYQVDVGPTERIQIGPESYTANVDSSDKSISLTRGNGGRILFDNGIASYHVPSTDLSEGYLVRLNKISTTTTRPTRVLLNVEIYSVIEEQPQVEPVRNYVQVEVSPPYYVSSSSLISWESTQGVVSCTASNSNNKEFWTGEKEIFGSESVKISHEDFDQTGQVYLYLTCNFENGTTFTNQFRVIDRSVYSEYIYRTYNYVQDVPFEVTEEMKRAAAIRMGTPIKVGSSAIDVEFQRDKVYAIYSDTSDKVNKLIYRGFNGDEFSFEYESLFIDSAGNAVENEPQYSPTEESANNFGLIGRLFGRVASFLSRDKQVSLSPVVSVPSGGVLNFIGGSITGVEGDNNAAKGKGKASDGSNVGPKPVNGRINPPQVIDTDDLKPGTRTTEEQTLIKGAVYVFNSNLGEYELAKTYYKDDKGNDVYAVDVCLDSRNIVEFYAEGGRSSGEKRVSCPDYHNCFNGACVPRNNLLSYDLDEDPSVSWDNKFERESKISSGYIEQRAVDGNQLDISGKPVYYPDKCSTNSQIYEGGVNNPNSLPKNCPSPLLCVDGACVPKGQNPPKVLPPQVIDTDDLKPGTRTTEEQTLIKGAIYAFDFDIGDYKLAKTNYKDDKGNDVYAVDVCLDSRNIQEWYVEGGSYGDKRVSCPDYHNCFDGKCVPRNNLLSYDLDEDPSVSWDNKFERESKISSGYIEQRAVDGNQLDISGKPVYYPDVCYGDQIYEGGVNYPRSFVPKNCPSEGGYALVCVDGRCQRGKFG